MSFIPGEGSETLTIASQNGSGITINAISDVNYLSANLIAGTNISLVPSVSDTSITINASTGGGGIASVASAVGSGIEATTVGSAVNLTSALVAGTGISLVPSGANKNLTINNTQTITTATGSGITATPSGSATALSANITAGNGISITPSGANTSKQISNTGVLSVNAGTGISVNQTTGNTTITNTGLTGLTSSNAGTNITITGTATNPTISATAGTGGTNTTVPIQFIVDSGVQVQSVNGVITNFPGTTVNISAGDYWLISAEYGMASSQNINQTMSLLMRFANTGRLYNLADAQQTTLGVSGTATALIRIPPGNRPNMTMCVAGSSGDGSTITASITNLVYTKLNLV